MSYILDALKKSDAERKQGDVPNLQTIHIPISTEPAAPLGLYGVISVLLLLLAFVVGWLLMDKESVQVTEVVPAPANKLISEPIAADAYISAAQAESVKVVRPQKSKPVVELAKASPKVIDAQRDKPKVQIQKQSLEPNTQVNIQANNAVPDLSDIPYLHEMPEYQQQSVPQMTFAGHVYSTNPSSRSVIINDVFMSEGDSVLPGINVIEITVSGVVFSLNDGYFRLDILQDWSFE